MRNVSFSLLVFGFLFVPAARAQSLVFHLAGQLTGEKLGVDIDASSDIDGDGLLDIVVSNPGFTALGSATGGAAVYSGATGVKLLQLVGDQQSFTFGDAVGAVGDTNGDGFGDVLVGDVWYQSVPGVSTGRAWLFSGATGAVLYALDGLLVDDGLGRSMCGLGDLDGDGKSDFAVSARTATNGAVLNDGAVYVHSGVDGHLLYKLTATAAGVTSVSYFGDALANGGDLNDDGLDDLLVGVPRDSISAPLGGRVLAYSGADGALLWESIGLVKNGALGTSVAAAGDVNGDGTPDAIVGATEFPLGPGYALVLSGADGALIHAVVGNQVAVLFGLAVGTAGDLDGDGKSEFMVGRAGFGEGVRVFDGATAALLFDLQSTTVFGGYGQTLDAADLDQDGTIELIIAAPAVTTGQVFNHGELDVISPLTRPFAASTSEVSLLAGGTVDFTLEAGPGEAGNLYWILGSVTGSTPGLPLGTGILPLNPDAYFQVTLTQTNTPLLPTSLGNLDATGSAMSSLVIPSASSPTLVGLVAYHAFAVLDSTSFAFTSTSNAVTTVLLP